MTYCSCHDGAAVISGSNPVILAAQQALSYPSPGLVIWLASILRTSYPNGVTPVRLFLRFCLCLATCTAVFADKIVLNDGREYEGVIVEETETTVKIKTARATVSFARNLIASIDRASGGGLLVDREKKLAALDGTTASGYLAAAEWMTGPGRETLDMQVLRRLCHAAASLDPKVAPAAMLLLGKELVAAGSRREAGRAFLRVLIADPDSPTAGKALASLRKELEVEARRNLTDLRSALDLVVKEKYEEAAPNLRKCADGHFSDASPTYVQMTFSDFATAIQKRVHCTPCGGLGILTCDVCGGDGLFDCEVCDGSGKQNVAGGTDPVTAFAETACRSCSGLGTVLCKNCKAERNVEIEFVLLQRPPPNSHPKVTVHAVAGKERDGLKIWIDLVKFKTLDNGAIPVKSVLGLPITAGGKVTCARCAGIPYGPPKTFVNKDGVTSWIAAIDDRLRGHTEIDLFGAVDGVFDPAIIAGGIRYQAGKWVR